MPRKSSTESASLRPVAFFLLLAATTCCGAQPSFRWSDREVNGNIEDSITSGIRGLENMRRGIVESSSLGDGGRNRQMPTSINGRLGNGSKGANSLAMKTTEVRQPRRQLDSAMYEALSKLANIQIAQPGIRDSSRSMSSQDGRGKYDERVNEEGTKTTLTNVGLSRTMKNVATTEKSSGKIQFSPRKFHCHPIREIYIPNVEKKMPAYACSLGKRAFVISSERFIQDSRDHFEVNVDEGTFRRLTPINSGITTLTSGVAVLPATLVLKQGEDGYTVRGVNANWKDVRAANGHN